VVVRSRVVSATALTALLIVSGRGAARAQDLEPRAYSASPVNTTFVVGLAGRSSGGVLTDPSLPLEDVHATLGSVAAGIGHTFDLFGRSALFAAVVPFARAHATGNVGGDAREATRTGAADTRLKLSVNLVGGAARRAREFAAAKRGTIVGVSLSAIVPTGQHMPDKLVNLGSNRWSFKPEIGISIPVRRWTLDGYAGVWLFGRNTSFYPGLSTLEQDPVTAIQGHASYTIRPRLWAAFDATWYAGGTTAIDGVSKADLQRNSRIGATLSLPLGTRQSLKVAYSTGATTRIGGDFDSFAVAWQMLWIR
jgi:Putative MetA-pathway of phenol degradation